MYRLHNIANNSTILNAIARLTITLNYYAQHSVVYNAVSTVGTSGQIRINVRSANTVKFLLALYSSLTRVWAHSKSCGLIHWAKCTLAIDTQRARDIGISRPGRDDNG